MKKMWNNKRQTRMESRNLNCAVLFARFVFSASWDVFTRRLHFNKFQIYVYICLRFVFSIRDAKYIVSFCKQFQFILNVVVLQYSHST